MQNTTTLYIVCECKYVVLGLQNLLPKFQVVESNNYFYTNNASFLIVAPPGRPFSELIEIMVNMRKRGMNRIGLLGTEGQAVFLRGCGHPPDSIFLYDERPYILARQLHGWMMFNKEIRPSIRLTGNERQVLLASLHGETPAQFCHKNGIEKKTFYTHRLRALKKIGLRKVNEMFINAVTGTPVSVEHYKKDIVLKYD